MTGNSLDGAPQRVTTVLHRLLICVSVLRSMFDQGALDVSSAVGITVSVH